MISIDELEIYNQLKKGSNIKTLAKKYGISRTKVRDIKDKGRYYLNMSNNEVIFTSKSISFEEQAFHYIHSNINSFNGCNINKPKEIIERPIVPRLTNFFTGYFDLKCDPSSKKILEKKLRGWSKKDIKLVGCNDKGIVDEEISNIFYKEFLFLEKDIISKNYYYDENSLPRGWKLWYLKISDSWLYYLKEYIDTHLDKKLTEKELYNNIMEKILNEKKSLKNNNTESIEKINQKIKFNYINSKIAYLLVKRYGDKVYKRLERNRILYMDLTAYYEGLLPEGMAEVVKKYI